MIEPCRSPLDNRLPHFQVQAEGKAVVVCGVKKDPDGPAASVAGGKIELEGPAAFWKALST